MSLSDRTLPALAGQQPTSRPTEAHGAAVALVNACFGSMSPTARRFVDWLLYEHLRLPQDEPDGTLGDAAQWRKDDELFDLALAQGFDWLQPGPHPALLTQALQLIKGLPVGAGGDKPAAHAVPGLSALVPGAQHVGDQVEDGLVVGHDGALPVELHSLQATILITDAAKLLQRAAALAEPWHAELLQATATALLMPKGEPPTVLPEAAHEWRLTVDGERYTLRQWAHGRVLATYRDADRATAATWLAAVVNGFEPTRALHPLPAMAL